MKEQKQIKLKVIKRFSFRAVNNDGESMKYMIVLTECETVRIEKRGFIDLESFNSIEGLTVLRIFRNKIYFSEVNYYRANTLLTIAFNVNQDFYKP